MSDSRRRLIRIGLPSLVLATAALGASAMIALRPAVEVRRPELTPPLVRALRVAPRSVTLSVESQGTVSPRTESQLVPEVSGRVVWVAASFASGGFFERGDELIRVESFDYEQAVTRARSEVAQARLRLAQERAEAEVARDEWRELGQGDGSPLALREPQVEQARAALAAAEAELERTGRDLERTRIRAPYAGRVRSKSVDVGQFVNRGSPVAAIYAVDQAEVRLPLPDDQLAFLDLPLDYRGEASPGAGPAVTLEAEFAGRVHRWQGRLVRTEGEIDSQSRMVHAVARVQDPYGRGDDPERPPLAAGLFVRAEIQGHSLDGIVVLPRQALRRDGRVLVVDSEDRLRFREIDLLRATRDELLVRGGLEPGERVCLSPLEAVSDGMRVRLAADGEAAGAGSGAGS
jgi:RND family efflux transporter MFP subunit